MAAAAERLKQLVRSVPDFPKPGIVFRDITTVISDARALRETVKLMADPFRDQGIDVVVGVESRGFIFGAAVAIELGVGFVPVRKPGKLPAETVREEYSLEYGTDAIEMHADAISKGQKVLMVDDLLATGGTMAAACHLVERQGGQVAGIAFLIELEFLGGRKKLADYKTVALIGYDSE
ncbi:MAG: adenine phosphoribosyltransferase [Planctomycetes bacterium]|nr:adenine phosphoribosyltransferase [Planctomycetota bacterium]